MGHFWKRLTRQTLAHLNFALRRPYHGKTIRTPVIAGIKVGIHTEEWMLGLIKHLFATSAGAFIDIGANLGQTLLKVKHLDPERDYVAFEPNPVCGNYLRELVRLNQYRATIVPVAVGGADDVLRLAMFLDYAADPSASIVPEASAGKAAVSELIVPVFKFEHLLKFIPEQVAIVKIDVEGAELEVLEGMAEFLRARQPVVLFEMLPAKAENAVRLERQHKVEALLRRINYSIFQVQKQQGQFAGLRKLTTLENQGDNSMCDYVGVPAGREAAVI